MKTPKVVYRFLEYTGYEQTAKYTTFSDDTKSVHIAGRNPLQFIDEDSTFKSDSIDIKDHQKEHSPFITRTVISFTEAITDKSLWKKFIDRGNNKSEYTGFAIGISTDKNSLDKIRECYDLDFGKVIYSDEECILDKKYSSQDIQDEKNSEIKNWIKSVILTKKTKYQNEREYRFYGKLKNYNLSSVYKIIKVPPKCISEVILGCKMDADVRSKTIAFCQQYLPNIPIRTAILENGKVVIK